MVVKKKLNIIIFGASGQIGEFFLNKFFQEKHNLLLFIKDNKKINNLKKKYKSKKFQKVIFEKLDIKKEKDIKKKFFKTKYFIKRTDLIINTIGIQGEINNFFKIDLKKFNDTFTVNFIAQVYFLRNIYYYIKKSKNLLIILFSGGGVTSLRENFSPYTLSKIALVKLVEILSKEFNNKRIRINAVSPGIINSKMIKQVMRNKSRVNNVEIKKIKKEIRLSDRSLKKLYELILFLLYGKGNKISGKIISSRWDKYNKWNRSLIKKIIQSDIFNLRRVER